MSMAPQIARLPKRVQAVARNSVYLDALLSSTCGSPWEALWLPRDIRQHLETLCRQKRLGVPLNTVSSPNVESAQVEKL